MELNITFLARQFFPHLLQTHAEKLIVDLLKIHVANLFRPLTATKKTS
jgi:hypothetical protein